MADVREMIGRRREEDVKHLVGATRELFCILNLYKAHVLQKEIF